MDQDVLFRIGLANHPETGPKLKQLADDVRSTAADINESIISVGRAAESARRLIGSSAPSRMAYDVPLTVAAASGHPSTTTTSRSDYELQLARLANTTPESLTQPAPRFSVPAREPQPMRDPALAPETPPAPVSVPQPTAPPSAPERDPYDLPKQGRKDASRYAKGFQDTLAQMTGMADGDLTMLVGGDDARFKQLGKERGEAYRKGMREQLTKDLGLTDDQAADLFGAQGGAGLAKQQADHAAESEQLKQSIIDNIEAWNALDEKGDAVKKSQGQNFREMAERAEGMASAVAQVASGLAFLGAKDESIEKVVQTLLTIKGFADIGVGTVKGLINIAQMVSLVRERQEMANKQTDVAAQKSALARAAAASYVQLLEREHIELERAVQGNKQHAALLQQVANEARSAAAATRDLNAAQAAGTPGGSPGARGGRGGRFRRGIGGFLSGAGSLLAGEAITSVGGGGLLSGIGGMAADSLIGGLGTGGAAAGGSAAAGAGAAGAGAAGAGAAAGIGSLAAAGAAAAAALGAVALVGVELKESFEGTATKAGSVTDTIGSWEARIADWVGDMTGLFDLIGNSEAASKADKALEERKKKEEENRIKNDASSEQQRMQREAGGKLEDRKRADISTLAGISSEVGKSSLLGLRERQANLQRELSGESQFGSLFQGGGSADRRQRAESLERRRRLQMELSNVGSTISGIEQTAGVEPGQELGARKLSLQKDLKKEMADIARLEKEGADSSTNYVSALQRADQLSQQLVQVEREQLELVRSQKDERMRANEVAIDGANKRLEMLKREREAAQQTLKSGAERFASLSSADQAAAKRAMALANAGGSERLSDRQRSLLRSIGTSSAVEAAEKADAAEAKKKGFFQSFGKEEQSRIAAAGRAEQQLKVEIANTQAVNVKIDLDYKRMAAEVVNTVKPIIARAQSQFQKEVDTQLNNNMTANMVRTNQELEKQRNLKKST